MPDPLKDAIASARSGNPVDLARISYNRGWNDAIESFAELFEPGGAAYGRVLACEEIAAACRRLVQRD